MTKAVKIFDTWRDFLIANTTAKSVFYYPEKTHYMGVEEFGRLSRGLLE